MPRHKRPPATAPDAVAAETLAAESFLRKLTAAVDRLAARERYDQLLRPRRLVDDLIGSPSMDAVVYLHAASAVLDYRCGWNSTAPLSPADVTTPYPGRRGEEPGHRLWQDRRFQAARREQLPREGQVWLLFAYAGREYEEIAELLGIDLSTVIEEAEVATNLFRA